MRHAPTRLRRATAVPSTIVAPARRADAASPCTYFAGFIAALLLVDHQAVVRVGAELGALPVARQHLHGVVEHARQQRLLVAKGVEMRPLPCRLHVPAARVLAVDSILGDNRFQPCDRRAPGIEQLARTSLRRSVRPASPDRV